MDFNYRCKKCNWGCFIDPDLIKQDGLLYQCTKCSSIYVVEVKDIDT
jgi:hypothetical protein